MAKQFPSQGNLKMTDEKELIVNTGSDLTAKIILKSGTDTYVAIAAAGTGEHESKWQCQKISEIGSTTVITWADGNTKFDNAASSLTALSYS